MGKFNAIRNTDPRPYRDRIKLDRVVSGRLTASEYEEAVALLDRHGVRLSAFVRIAFLAAFAQLTGHELGAALAIFPFQPDAEPSE